MNILIEDAWIALAMSIVAAVAGLTRIYLLDWTLGRRIATMCVALSVFVLLMYYPIRTKFSAGNSVPILFDRVVDQKIFIHIGVDGDDPLTIIEYGLQLTSGTIKEPLYRKASLGMELAGSLNTFRLGRRHDRAVAAITPTSNHIEILGQFKFGDEGNGSCVIILDKHGDVWSPEPTCKHDVRDGKIIIVP